MTFRAVGLGFHSGVRIP